MARHSVPTRMTLAQTALAFTRRGYFLVPLHPATKAAKDKQWTQLRMSEQDVVDHWDNDPDANIGLLLGVEVAPQVFLASIDIDTNDEVIIERVQRSLSGPGPIKRGKKGQTVIVRTRAPIKKVLIKAKPKTPAVIEVLAAGQQTVVPPSIHPETNLPYEWIGPRSLLEFDPQELPLFDEGVLRELELAVRQPDAKLFGLNEMRPPTDGEPGNMHELGQVAVASMVAYQFTDDQIMRRVMRAMEEGDARHGHTGRDMGKEHHKITEWLRSSREKNHQTVDRKKRGDEPSESADVLLAKWMMNEWRDGNCLYSRSGQMLVYENGHFKSYSPDAFFKQLARCGNEQIMGLGHRGWVQITNTALAMTEEFPQHKSRKVCLSNGTLDLDTGQLEAWSRDDFLISQLEIEHDPEALCPQYVRFVNETFAHEDQEETQKAIETYEEFVAMTMFECHDFHRFLVLEGTTRGGKSVLISIAKFMHHDDSISSVMAHDFGRESSRTSMLGKLLNVTGETSTVNSVADDYLKLIVAGERVDVRHLYFGGFSAVLPTRIMIATNDPLKTKDTSGAVMERMLILRCDNYVPKNKRDIHLTEKLATERPGILNRMVKAWHRLRDRRVFDPPKASQLNAEQFQIDNNPVMQWVLECTHQGIKLQEPSYEMPPGIVGYTQAGVLYMDYTDWAKARGFMQMNIITWGMKLTQIRAGGLDLSSQLKRFPTSTTGPLRVRNLSLLQHLKY